MLDFLTLKPGNLKSTSLFWCMSVYEQNGVLSNRMNLKGITNANSDIQMLPGKSTAQPRKAQQMPSKVKDVNILVFAQQCSFLIQSEQHFFHWMFKWKGEKEEKEFVCVWWLVCNTHYDRGKTSGGVIALCMTLTMNLMTHWGKALTAENSDAYTRHVRDDCYYVGYTFSMIIFEFLNKMTVKSISKEHGGSFNSWDHNDLSSGKVAAVRRWSDS